MVLDVKRAFLYGHARRRIYLKLPKEDPRYGQGVMGRLLRSMYGTRDAPQIWQGEVRAAMTSIGFRACRSKPCVYRHDAWCVDAITHVDAFLLVGPKWALNKVKDALQGSYELKAKMLGPDRDEDKVVNFLGREV